MRKYQTDDKKIIAETGKDEDYVRVVSNNLRSGVQKKIEVLCVSEDIKSILMWSHYSTCHTGFALEYDFEKYSEYQLKKNESVILPVLYSKERVDITNSIIDDIKNGIKKNYKYKKDDLYWVKALSCKNKDWDYEKEWRFVKVEECIGQQCNKSIEVVNPTAIDLGIKMSVK